MKHSRLFRPRTRMHTLLRSTCPSLVAALLVGSPYAKSVTLTWDPGATPATGSYGNGTWDAGTTTNWSNGVADQAFSTGNTAVFAGTSTGTATVTLGSAISALNLQFLSGGYTVTPSATNTLALTGGFNVPGAGATIYAGAAAGSTTTVGGPITVSSTASVNTPAYFSAAAGNTLNLTGTITQTTPASSGNTIYGPGIVNYSGTGFAVGKFNVQGGATFNTTGAMTGFTGTYAGIGGDSATTTSTWNVGTGGAVAGGAVTLFVGNGTIGGVSTSGVFSQSGGTAAFTALNAGNTFNGGTTPGDSNGMVTVSGGTLTINGAIRLGSTGAGVGTLNLTTGGRLLISSTAGTIARASGTTGATGGSGTINFNGGVIQYNAAATSPAIAANITTNILEGGAFISTNGSAITIASPIGHGGVAAIDGGLTKSATTGILTLTSANTYTGPTLVSTAAAGGTAANTGLSITVNGGLGSSDVTLQATTSLTLGTGVTAAHNNNTTSTLTLVGTSSIVNLTAATAGTVQDTVGALVVNGTSRVPGTYGSATSGVPAGFQLTQLTGNGTLVVTGVVPEPSTWAMMIGGFAGLVGLTLRRRSRV